MLVDINGNIKRKKMNYKKNRVTLQVRIPKDVAVSILGRLYAWRYISREQYEAKISQIDEDYLETERKKREKMDKIFAKFTLQ